MSDRLRTHLLAINIYEAESSHSSRRWCAIILRGGVRLYYAC